MVEPGWTGRRVSVRRVVADDVVADGEGRASGRSGAVREADVVGDLLGVDAQTAVIETRSGLVEVALSSVTAARLAPPSTADELALEGVMALGWRPAETGSVGGWVLRANSGTTQRANSVLPLRAPGMPLPEAIERAAAWYAERGLPLRFQVPTEARRLLDAALGELGWPASADVNVLVRRLGPPRPDSDVDDATAGHPSVELAPIPSDAWCAQYRGGFGLEPPVRALLTRHDRVVFAGIAGPGAELVAIARGCVDDGWLGVTTVAVAPEHRRQGLARRVMAAVHDWGRANGATRAYLAVASENVSALALYSGLGYWHHHDYRYRLAP